LAELHLRRNGAAMLRGVAARLQDRGTNIGFAIVCAAVGLFRENAFDISSFLPGDDVV
jgi:hypothetical protein